MTQSDTRQRLAAILVADAVGFSRLMERDERATIASLDTARGVFRSLIESRQGRVVDMAGDSLLAVFDAASAAVEVALRAQSQLQALPDLPPADRRMRFRVGVHLGDVFEKPDGTVYGDGVNIAARLQSLAPPGGVCVSDMVRAAVRDRIPAVFDDQGEQAVKNISQPLHVFAVRTPGAAPPAATSAAPVTSPETRPSLAVMPFATVGADQDDMFVDGLVEDLITECSRFTQILVIARNSSFSYRGRSVGTQIIGRELGVRYLLQGSLQRQGRRIRARVALVEAESGAQIWAERYERAIEDVFALQEELTHAIVTALWPHLEQVELHRARLTGISNPDAYRLALLARQLLRQSFLQGGDPSIEARAEALLARAEQLQSESGEVLRARAYLCWLRLWSGNADDPETCLEQGLAATRRAIELNAGDYLAYHRRALLKSLSGQADNGLLDIRHAFDLNPNDSGTVSMLAAYEAGHGDGDAAGRMVAETLRLSPRDPLRLHFFNIHQFICHYAGRYEECLQWCDRALGESPDHAPSRYLRVLALSGLDRVDHAREEAVALRQTFPAFARSRFGGGGPRYCAQATWLREMTLLERAGLLEGPLPARTP